MKKEELEKKNSILLFSEGEYDDYRTLKIVKVLSEFSMKKVLQRFINMKTKKSLEPINFVKFLEKKKLIKIINAKEVYFQNEGNIKIDNCKITNVGEA